MATTRHTLHLTPAGGLMSPHRAVRGWGPQVNACPPDAFHWASSPGLAPVWGLGNPILGRVNRSFGVASSGTLCILFLLFNWTGLVQKNHLPCCTKVMFQFYLLVVIVFNCSCHCFFRYSKSSETGVCTEGLQWTTRILTYQATPPGLIHKPPKHTQSAGVWSVILARVYLLFSDCSQDGLNPI